MRKGNTLRKNYEFQDIISLKQQIVSKYLIFYYQKSKDNLKVGISISKKFANAVYRNKYKRQVRAILDSINKYQLKYNIVIILRKEFLPLSFENKTALTKEMFERLENAKKI